MMEKSEVIKDIPSRGLIKLNKKKRNVDYDYKASQQQNESPVSFYEEDFPSLSEIGLKNNSHERIMTAHENSSSYSARLKIPLQNERSKSGKVYSGQNSNLRSSHSFNAVHSPSKKKKYPESNQHLKSERCTDKSLTKNFEFSKQASNHIQKAIIPSHCAKTSEVEIKDEGEWIVVKGKSLSDRNILKESGQVKHKKTNKSNLNVQSSFRSNYFNPREYNDQNVNINMTEKWGNMRDNFNNKKLLNVNQGNEFCMAEDHHSKFTRKKHLFVEKTQDQQKIVNSRSSQFDKGHPNFELRNKIPVHGNHCDENFSLKDVKNFSNFMQSREAGFSQFSVSESFSNPIPQRNFNENFVAKNEHSEAKFGKSIKSYQKSSLKQNLIHSQVAKNTQHQTKASSGSSRANEVAQLRSHEFRNKDSNSKNSSAENFYSPLSNDKNNISSKGNQLNKTQTANLIMPSRKKRKSKVKRQAAMQSDKIRLITPETFSKILNQKNNESIQLQNISSVNINDCDEYPELGVSMTPKCNLENSLKNVKTNLKRENSALTEIFDLKNDTHSAKDSSEENSCLPSNIVIKVNELNQSECEHDDEEKVPVHCNDPITISIFDMLQVNKIKKKESEKSSDTSKISPSKINAKKLVSFENRHFVNPLDSSKPAVKRGKEREKPKPKKLSQLKKIILMDRKKRKESQMSIMKENFSDNSSKNDSSVMSFNKCVINEINLELLSQSNDMLEKNIIDLEMATSEVNECLQDSVNILNTDSNLSKEINNISPIHVPSKVENIVMETCKNSDSCCMQTCSGALKLNGDMKTVDCDALKLLSNNSFMNDEDIPSNLENYMVSDMVTASLDDLYFIEKYKHLMEKYSAASNLPNIETNYAQNIDQKNIDNDDALFDIRLLFNSEYKCIFSGEKNVGKYSCEYILFDIRNLFKYPNKEETLLEKEVVSVLNDIRYLFERENCKTHLHNENISEITSIPLNENFSANIGNDICSLEEDFNTNSENVKEITKLEECICSMDISAWKHRNSSIHCKYSEKEILEASHVLLHSKKFRSYCTHFLSKELEETVYVLLDDLVRFQDRMHQKDPVKARMKRRLLYGLREIKRHMKLKKLKCIIIASDIEDSKTEGGLNDIVNDLKSLAKNYQIPCVFSHSRRKLGYICHKSAPISAVGIFNYEGAEVNFKKMLEMQNECKLDYEEVIKVLSLKLTDEQIDLIFKTIKEDMSNLYDVVNTILKEYFPKPVLETIEDTINESMKNKSSIKETEFNSDNEKVSNSDEAICTDTEISSTTIVEENKIIEDLKDIEEVSKIYNILEKYKCINY